MILHPTIIALLTGSILTGFLVLYAAARGFEIIKRWDIASGSEIQLLLERRTYLISLMLSYAFVFQMISLFLFVYTTDNLSRLFAGAMCAAGTLYINSYGYPTLLLKVINFLLAGVWLLINATDNKAYNYPLIKKKYLLLILMAPFVLAETISQIQYFIHMSPDIVTSCCGTLFSSAPEIAKNDMPVRSGGFLQKLFFGGFGLLLLLGIYSYRGSGKGGCMYGIASIAMFVVSIMALISIFSLYIYELPTHHCPFCLLQREYGYVGYPIYLTLFLGNVSGISVGALSQFRNISSLSGIIPAVQRKLVLTSLVCYIIFTGIVLYELSVSNLHLDG